MFVALKGCIHDGWLYFKNLSHISKYFLYHFLIEGTLPKPQFTDGDTIVVGRKGSTITAEGAVRNSFEFEIPSRY